MAVIPVTTLEHETTEYVVTVDGTDYRPGELISVTDIGDSAVSRFPNLTR